LRRANIIEATWTAAIWAASIASTWSRGLTWPNGAKALLFSAEDPEVTRDGQHQPLIVNAGGGYYTLLAGWIASM
jgi:hypothetical protein